VREGSLVQPGNGINPGAVLVTVTQIDPISVAFTLPERELSGLQSAMRAGPVSVTAVIPDGRERLAGKVTFVDNAVDSTTGTIRVKADFDNPAGRLWPGQFVNVELSPSTLRNATVVPVQAVQTGPDNRYVFVVGADKRVVQTPVKLTYVEEKFAVVDGLSPGTRVVVEGAQNLRPGSAVAEAQRDTAKGDGGKGEPRKDRPA